MAAIIQERAALLEAWVAELYTRLRAAEARAQDTTRTPIELQAAVAHARYIAAQIERFQDALYRIAQ